MEIPLSSEHMHVGCPQATGQMMSDDWGWDAAEDDWYANPDYEWRSSLVQADNVPVLDCQEEGIDITGTSLVLHVCCMLILSFVQSHCMYHGFAAHE